MPIWSIPSAAEEPSTDLISWAVFEVQMPHKEGRPTRHVVGEVCRWGGEGRVSSEITEFDPARRIFRTSSGRVIGVRGRPGMGSQASYVWNAWFARSNSATECDVSDEYQKAIEAKLAENFTTLYERLSISASLPVNWEEVKHVATLLGAATEDQKIEFFLTPNQEVHGLTPLQGLEQHHFRAVCRAAQRSPHR